LPSTGVSSGIDAIFNPHCVALIGASAAPEKAGGRRWKTLVEGGFEGDLFPIHPRAKEILGRRAYPSITAVPVDVDLAVIMVGPDDVPRVVEESLAQGARGIVVISAGFGEVSESGRRVEQKLAKATRSRGARLIGPNCAGIYSGPAKVNVLGWEMRPGRIGLVSQSGNVALDFADYARKAGEGFSRALTIGNAADVGAVDFIEYSFQDPETDVVLAYLEAFGPLEGRRLCDLVANARTPKPIVLLKPGRSEGGKRAALSHTGSLAGEDRVIDAALKQYGILRVAEVEEAWQVAVALSRRVPMLGSGVAVLTDGGGHATQFCDAAGLVGLTTPPFADRTRRNLKGLLSERCAMSNPVDFAGLAEGEPGIIPKVLDICLSDPSIGSAVMVGHFGGYEKLGGPTLRSHEVSAAEGIAETHRRHNKPVHVHSVHADSGPPALATLRERGILVHRSVEMPAKILRHLADASRQDRPGRYGVARPASQGIRPAQVYPDASWLQEPETRSVLRSWGIAVPEWEVVTSADDCARSAERFGSPVVLKIIAEGAVHKSDIGGVLLNIDGPNRAAQAFRELMERAEAASLKHVRIVVTAMVRGDAELIIGGFRDTQFGPVIMVGMGGVFVEVLDDVSFRLAPVSETMAAEMLGELKGSKLFRGYRGGAPIDVGAVPVLLARLSTMMAECQEILEVDINPLILGSGGAHVGDARVVLSTSGTYNAAAAHA
jgi:acetyltransferase